MNNSLLTSTMLVILTMFTTINAFSTTSPLSLRTKKMNNIIMNTKTLYASALAEPETTIRIEKNIGSNSTYTAAGSDTITITDKEESSPPTPKSYLDDGFVFGLEGSGLHRPKGKVSVVVVEGDGLETTTKHRLIVWGTMFGQFSIAAYSISQILQTHSMDGTSTPMMAIGLTFLQTLLITLTSWTVADFGSGVLHWSVDNYGNGRTPVVGGLIAAFQGHHSAMWTICERGFENNVHKLCIPFGVQTVLALKLLFGLNASATYFITIFCVMEIMSQEFHKMSHATKSDAGPIWNALQDNGLVIDRKSHAQHHIAPYEGSYCIMSGMCNKVLDESGIFRRMEHIIYQMNGVESNAWKLDPKLRERTLRGEYGIPVTRRSKSMSS